MKNAIISVLIFISSFVLATIFFLFYLNSEKSNTVYELPDSKLPVILMQKDEVVYNPLFGHTSPVDNSVNRDTLSIVGSDRKVNFLVEVGTIPVLTLDMEVRNLFDNTLIETDSFYIRNMRDGVFEGGVVLKDLYDLDKQYVLNFKMSTDEYEGVTYSTIISFGDDYPFAEMMDFADSFHRALYKEDTGRGIIKYLETNSSLKENNTYVNVNINSDFKSVIYGEMGVRQYEEEYLTLCDISDDSATIKLDYVLFNNRDDENVFYKASEEYKLKESKGNIYLMDYNRKMEELPNVRQMVKEGVINLGVVDENADIRQNHEGDVVAFDYSDSLYVYNYSKNELSVLASDFDLADPVYKIAGVKRKNVILDVKDDGGVIFLTYGYEFRGAHEGEMAILVMLYDSEKNDMEELCHIPCDKSFEIMDAGMSRLTYLNGAGQLYIYLENKIYCVDINKREVSEFVSLRELEKQFVSPFMNIIVWKDVKNNGINISDFEASDTVSITPERGEKIIPFGFIGSDIVYGVARDDAPIVMIDGNKVSCMYKLCIVNADGNIMKEYEPEGMLISEVKLSNNRIDIERVTINNKGAVQSAIPDLILNSLPEVTKADLKNITDDEIYKNFVKIKKELESDKKETAVLTPKYVELEESRRVELPENDTNIYYVYSGSKVSGMYVDEAKAISLANLESGLVLDSMGDVIWQKRSKSSRNQILSITEKTCDEGENSLGVCLNTMMEFVGIVRDSHYMIKRGQSPYVILSENMEGRKVLDLTGCKLETLYFYLNQDYPVLAKTAEDAYVLITGYNETNLVFMDPAKGEIYKKSISECEKLFDENGKVFITYIE